MLYFDDTGGNGPVVLCLAGLTRNSSDFDYAMSSLSRARVIRMDYRGRGKSDWCDDFTTYSISREAKDVLELLDHLGLERTAILGTSRGGLIALTLATMARHTLSGVCFNDVGPVIEFDGLKTIVPHVGRNPPYSTVLEATRALVAGVTGFHNVPLTRWRDEVKKRYIETTTGLVINYDPKLRASVLASVDPNAQPLDLWPIFDALSGMPLAALRGANSNILSAETLANMQARLPMIAATVRDRGHVPFLDEPECITVLTDWVNALCEQEIS